MVVLGKRKRDREDSRARPSCRYNRLHTIFNKAHELSKDLDADVAIIVVMDDINWLYSSKRAAEWPPVLESPRKDLRTVSLTPRDYEEMDRSDFVDRLRTEAMLRTGEAKSNKFAHLDKDHDLHRLWSRSSERSIAEDASSQQTPSQEFDIMGHMSNSEAITCFTPLLDAWPSNATRMERRRDELIREMTALAQSPSRLSKRQRQFDRRS